ncbi:8-oxo-dGTP diphosphatase MutT [Zhongshania marina]|uniref:8-oxo-dGTP diphosphatase n=1 Tax=Zhongshania marina TaxID=2304603 RepID=A0A2S4HI16_9GAMM|nr:8-oxo-dGTP diphosphatase MutT [Marortus luteolus]POP53560.1 8-oxo-dGTP diphosphatase MutT [Marortus luteolus]
MQNTAVNKRVHVAVGVIFNSQGQILIARRHDDAHQGGLWEFPGGKVESDESVCDALARELHEELGISIQASSCKPLIEIRHDYSDKVVLLDVWTVSEFDGEASGKEGQPLRWVDRCQLSDYDFPAANIAIIGALMTAG